MRIFVAILVVLGLVLALVRVLFGKTIFDKIAAFDTANVIIVSLIVFFAYYFKNDLYLDIALVFAIVGFVETVVFARILEKTMDKNGE